jgi:hypothetical protein
MVVIIRMQGNVLLHNSLVVRKFKHCFIKHNYDHLFSVLLLCERSTLVCTTLIDSSPIT